MFIYVFLLTITRHELRRFIDQDGHFHLVIQLYVNLRSQANVASSQFLLFYALLADISVFYYSFKSDTPQGEALDG